MVDPSPSASGTLRVSAGEMVYRRGEAAEAMFVILAGRVRLRGAPEAEGEVLGAGDFFGEASLLEGQPRTHGAEALEDLELLPVNRGSFLRMIRQSPEVSVKMLRRLTQRLADLGARLEAREPRVSATTQAPQARLVSVFTGHPFDIPPGGAQVGRADPALGIAPEVDLTAEDPTHSVSRRHARILRVGEGYFLREEPTAPHGTFLRGERLGPEDCLELRPGDRVGFGMVVLFFEKA